MGPQRTITTFQQLQKKEYIYYQMKVFSYGTVMFQLLILSFKLQKENQDIIKRHYKNKNALQPKTSDLHVYILIINFEL